MITLNDTNTHFGKFLWTKDWPVTDTSSWQHTTFITDSQPSGGIRTRTPNKQAASDRAATSVDLPLLVWQVLIYMSLNLLSHYFTLLTLLEKLLLIPVIL